MEICKGTVVKIESKEIPADQFGNTYKRSMQVGRDWYDLGGGKRPIVNIKVDGEWVELDVNYYVEFTYETRIYNGKEYRNAKSSNIKIKTHPATNQVQAEVSKPSSNVQGKASPAVTVKTNYEVGVSVGQAVNAAVQINIALAEHSGDTSILSNEALEKTAWEVVALTNKMKSLYEQRIESANAESSPKAEIAFPTNPVVGTTKKEATAPLKNASVTNNLLEFADDSLPF